MSEPLDYYHARPSRKQRKRSRLALYVWLWSALAYVAAMLLPYLAGETWGMVWFILSLPLSGLAEEKWGIGRDSHLLILVITLINGVIVGAMLAGLVVVVRDSFRRRR
jgi:hypothetical protein